MNVTKLVVIAAVALILGACGPHPTSTVDAHLVSQAWTIVQAKAANQENSLDSSFEWINPEKEKLVFQLVDSNIQIKLDTAKTVEKNIYAVTPSGDVWIMKSGKKERNATEYEACWAICNFKWLTSTN